MMTLPLLALSLAAAPPVDSATRAVAYLVAEVPRWPRDHKCYSCHHSGDAARALLAAKRLGYRVPNESLADTVRWLARPAGWDKNGGEGPFNDPKLARVQFAATLAASDNRNADKLAAKLLAEVQDDDGSWRVVPAGSLGGATTLGAPLATALARDALAKLDPKGRKPAIDKADAWLREAPIQSVLDAAAVLHSPPDEARRKRAYALLRDGESRGGGWGPYTSSPPEPFDTAVVLVGLAAQKPTPETKAWIRRGRAYLRETQESDGSWPETTRPAGGDSYSQRLSTSGWATLALLLTSPRRER